MFFAAAQVGGNWHSTLTVVNAANLLGVAYVWSGRQWKGESATKKAAEHSAAKAFFADPDVRHTAAHLEPGYPTHSSEARKIASRQRRKFRRLRQAVAQAAAIEKQRQQALCQHLRPNVSVDITTSTVVRIL